MNTAFLKSASVTGISAADLSTNLQAWLVANPTFFVFSISVSGVSASCFAIILYS